MFQLEKNLVLKSFQKVEFTEALRRHNLGSAERLVAADSSLLTGEPAWRVRVTQAPLGPTHSWKEVLDVWAWLDTHGFAFPTETDPKGNQVLRHLLEHEDLHLVDAWRARCGADVLNEGVWIGCLWRSNADGLRWWEAQGQRVPEVASPHQAGQRYPNLLGVLSARKLEAHEHVAWLLSRGARPLRSHDGITPVLALARHLRDKEHRRPMDLSSVQAEQFRTTWTALLRAGDDPTAPDAVGETALSVLDQTSMGAWWTAQERHRVLTADESSDAPSSRRLRA